MCLAVLKKGMNQFSSLCNMTIFWNQLLVVVSLLKNSYSFFEYIQVLGLCGVSVMYSGWKCINNLWHTTLNTSRPLFRYVVNRIPNSLNGSVFNVSVTRRKNCRWNVSIIWKTLDLCGPFLILCHGMKCMTDLWRTNNDTSRRWYHIITPPILF